MLLNRRSTNIPTFGRVILKVFIEVSPADVLLSDHLRSKSIKKLSGDCQVTSSLGSVRRLAYKKLKNRSPRAARAASQRVRLSHSSDTRYPAFYIGLLSKA